MSLIETEALVLRSYPLAEADRIVVFLTRDHGVVRCVAKGAKRLKSRFGSSLEPFSTVRLTYLHKDDRELHLARQTELVESHFRFAASPEALATFSYIADLVMSLVPPNDPDHLLYRMTSACLATEPNEQDLPSVRLYFEVWLLKLGGYLPNWAECTSCRSPIDPDAAYLQPDFQLMCVKCTRSGKRSALAPAVLSLAKSVRRLRPEDFLSFARGQELDVSETSRIMRAIISLAAGRPTSEAAAYVL